MTGVVLIGGKSRRFGSDKVLAPLGQKRLVEHVIDIINPLFDEIVLVGHTRKGLEKFRVVPDVRPGCGPLGGICTALGAVSNDYCFVFAADMPNLSRDLISSMISRTDDHDIVIPVWSQGREPLHAIYHRRVLPVVESLIAEDNFRVFSLIEQVDTLTIPEDVLRSFGDPSVMFSNVNTLGDLDRMAPSRG